MCFVHIFWKYKNISIFERTLFSFWNGLRLSSYVEWFSYCFNREKYILFSLTKNLIICPWSIIEEKICNPSSWDLFWIWYLFHITIVPYHSFSKWKYVVMLCDRKWNNSTIFSMYQWRRSENYCNVQWNFLIFSIEMQSLYTLYFIIIKISDFNYNCFIKIGTQRLWFILWRAIFIHCQYHCH